MSERLPASGMLTLHSLPCLRGSRSSALGEFAPTCKPLVSLGAAGAVPVARSILLKLWFTSRNIISHYCC